MAHSELKREAARRALDTIAPKADALRRQIQQFRVDIGNALVHEELTTVEDWRVWNAIAGDIEREAHSTCGFLRWQSGSTVGGAR
jgi:hypothetical protein